MRCEKVPLKFLFQRVQMLENASFSVTETCFEVREDFLPMQTRLLCISGKTCLNGKNADILLKTRLLYVFFLCHFSGRNTA